MPRTAYLLEVDPMDITYIAWAAGLASGSGNKEQADAFMAMLSRVQAFELPDDEPTEQAETVVETVAEPEIERVPDPNFMPPAASPPLNHQSDFGAGPPPGI